MIFQMHGVNSLQIIPRLLSWVIFIAIAFVLLKRKKMTSNNAFLLIGFSVLINGFLLGILGSFPNPVQPIQSLALGNFNPLYLIIIIALIVVSILVGRLFCGYACPVGVFQEFLYRIREKLLKRKGELKISSKITQYIRTGVFGLMLVLGLIVVPAMGLFEIINPFHFFSFKNFSVNTTFWLSLIIFTTSFFVYRPFCRMFCPFGFLAGLFTRISPNRTHLRRTEGCTSCKLCEKLCPSMDYADATNHGECYLCGRCIDKCPKDTLEYQIKK